MMTRISLSLLLASSLFTATITTACADENSANSQSASAASAPITEVGKDYGLIPTTAADWRELDPESTLYIKTKYGTFVVELLPEIAPNHVAQIKKLTRQGFYNDLTFHRVLNGFMNQTGDPRGDGTGDSELPDIAAEFTFRRNPDTMPANLVSRELTIKGEVDTGFYKALPIATKPSSQAFMTKDGAVESWGLHCPSVTSMARGEPENSANSQFFLMRGENKGLNTKYSIWGTTVWGRPGLKKIKAGTIGKDAGFVPDVMEKVQIAADVPKDKRIAVQILRTNSKAFAAYIAGQKSKSGKAPDVCDVEVPTRLKP